MRVANLAGRLALIEENGAVDVNRASSGLFGAGPQAIYEQWDAFSKWAVTVDRARLGEPFDPADLGSPSPYPRQVFAVGLNYAAHASESGFRRPDEHPPVFTKFPSCITGPFGTVRLPRGGHTDWEVELVAVIGVRAEHIRSQDAWSHVAGLAVGQDLSERILQMASPSPQFSLGKSYPGFGPIGPWLVSVDGFADPDDLELGCWVNGEEVQKGRTSELIFSIPLLIETLSAVTPLLPGDVIFSGTPSGVGMGRHPQRFLSPGDELVSYVEGVGEMRHWFVA
jgi:2-keto-4-pentenoate hydratase/2-oxohepta-3-ene-1,7-dioic acid hydratase in catechol pathway